MLMQQREVQRPATPEQTAIRITDPHIIRLVKAEQLKAGEGTATRTAGRLIAERLAIREASVREDQRTQAPTAA
jgi:hypothetical protein